MTDPSDDSPAETSGSVTASPGKPKVPERALSGCGGIAFLLLYVGTVPGVAAALGARSAPPGWSRSGFAGLAAVAAVVWAAAGLGLYAAVARLAGPARRDAGPAAGKIYLFLTAAVAITAHALQRPLERNLSLVLLGTALGWVLVVGLVGRLLLGAPRPPSAAPEAAAEESRNDARA